jgi:phosphoglycolate phosphatase
MFDLDGTLVDSLRDLAEAMNRVLTSAGLPTHPVEKYRDFIGNGIDKLVERALPPDQWEPGLLAGHVVAMKNDYGVNWHRHTQPYAGVPAMLERLSQKGVKLTVLSNKPHEYTIKFIDRFFPDNHFEAVRGAKPEVPRKPDPTAALDIARGLGLAPAGILYLGDSSTDMLTARSAGMYAAGAAWGFSPRQELLDAGAQAVLESPLDLARLLD